MRGMYALPDDVEMSKPVVIDLRARQLSDKLLIKWLRLELAKLKRMQFGRSSEQQIDDRILDLGSGGDSERSRGPHRDRVARDRGVPALASEARASALT